MEILHRDKELEKQKEKYWRQILSYNLIKLKPSYELMKQGKKPYFNKEETFDLHHSTSQY